MGSYQAAVRQYAKMQVRKARIGKCKLPALLLLQNHPELF